MPLLYRRPLASLDALLSDVLSLGILHGRASAIAVLAASLYPCAPVPVSF